MSKQFWLMQCREIWTIGTILIWTVPFGLAGSSNSLLDVSTDGTRLLVANPDNGSVTVVDVKEQKAVRATVLRFRSL